MNTRDTVAVIVADTTPATIDLEQSAPASVETIDTVTAPGPRVIYLAATKAQGETEAAEQGLNVVAIITPRALDAARGITADDVVASASLTDEQAAELRTHATPSMLGANEED